MYRKPLFIFAYANHKNASLPFLAMEDNAIKKLFRRFTGRLEFESGSHTSLKTIHQMFNYGHNRIVWFHFSGHASPEEILLIDHPAPGQNLAALVAMEKRIMVVFLNGCSSEGLLQSLFAADAKVVIATKDAIEDEKACKFSTQFYEALIAGKSIKAAFKTARNELAVEYNLQSDNIFFRGILFREPAEDNLWGLYAAESTYLDWTLSRLLRWHRTRPLAPLRTPFRLFLGCAALFLFCWLSFFKPELDFQRALESGDCVKMQQYEENGTKSQSRRASKALQDPSFLIIGKWREGGDEGNLIEFQRAGNVVISKDMGGRGAWKLVNRQDNSDLLIYWDGDAGEPEIFPGIRIQCNLLLFDSTRFSKR